MSTEWIKMSERKPTEADYPIWMESPEWCEPEKPRLVYTSKPFLDVSCDPARYWMPAKLPAPPKEKTQQELDDEAFICDWIVNLPPRGVWHAALKWEREQVGAMLNELLIVCRSKVEGEAIDRLRKRCGLQ